MGVVELVVIFWLSSLVWFFLQISQLVVVHINIFVLNQKESGFKANSLLLYYIYFNLLESTQTQNTITWKTWMHSSLYTVWVYEQRLNLDHFRDDSQISFLFMVLAIVIINKVLTG